MVYVNCPICGHKLIEGDDIGIVIVKCNKCDKKINISIKDNKIQIKINYNQALSKSMNCDAALGLKIF